MYRRGWAAWTLDAVAVGVAAIVLVAAGARPFGAGPAAPAAPASLVLIWSAIAAAATTVGVAAVGRRPPLVVWAGTVALALAIPGLATVALAPAVRIVAVALGAGFALAVATFTHAVAGVRSRLAARALAVATIAAVVARLVLRDPIRELRCAPYCRDNPLLVVAGPDWVAAADRVLAIVTLAWCLVMAAQFGRFVSSRWSRTSAALVIGAAATASAISLAWPGLTTWSDHRSSAPTVVPVLLIAAFLLATHADVQVWRTRRQVRALTSSLSSTLASSSDVDGLVAHLRRIAGDRSVRLLFREPSGRDVDEQGQPTQRDVRLAATVVERDGEPIAVIEHEPSSGNVVAAALTPAVTVAIENERLRALAQSELDALRTSRRRIVERADETRRRLERDLHDGAQQRLLLLGMELSRAAASADDPCERDRYLVAVAETQAALAELRRLVHERTPPVLDELGLVEALRSLAEASSVPVVIAQDPSDPSDLRRPSIATERAVYGVALSIIRNAEASGASKVSIALTSSDRHFTATFDHDATAPILDLTDDEDRVGAVGGNLDVTIGAQRAHGLHAMASFPREGAP